MPDTLDFYRRRLWRILPSYLLAVGVALVFAVANGPITAAGVLTGQATGLSANTVYWLRAVLTNDVITAVEPEARNFRKLQETAERLSGTDPDTASQSDVEATGRFRLINAAVGDHCGETTFTHGVGKGGAVDVREIKAYPQTSELAGERRADASGGSRDDRRPVFEFHLPDSG